MIAAYILFALAIAALALLRNSVISAILFTTLLLAFPILYFDTLARPKALSEEIRRDAEVGILGYTYTEGVAVYYLMALPGLMEPRLYYEPWTDESRARVEKMQGATERGETMVMRLPFERSLSEARDIHPLPQPALPIKKQPPEIPDFSE